MLEREGGSKTDWARVDAMSQEEVERLADEEEGPLSEDWNEFTIEGLPWFGEQVPVQVDADLVRWFKTRRSDYQTCINFVLRAYMQAKLREKGKAA